MRALAVIIVGLVFAWLVKRWGDRQFQNSDGSDGMGLALSVGMISVALWVIDAVVVILALIFWT